MTRANKSDGIANQVGNRSCSRTTTTPDVKANIWSVALQKILIDQWAYALLNVSCLQLTFPPRGIMVHRTEYRLVTEASGQTEPREIYVGLNDDTRRAVRMTTVFLSTIGAGHC